MAGKRSGGTICVSLAEPDVAACLAALADVECAEIRLDAMAVTATEVGRLFEAPRALVATCRPGRHDDETRLQLLLAAIEAGATFVDVELDAPEPLRNEVLSAARATGCRAILSFHDERGTPSRDELCTIRDRCFDAGADLAKLACWVRGPQDAARLLGMLDSSESLIVVGMGPLGRIVRLTAPLLGSALAYVCASSGRETAPGQLSRLDFERLLQEWADD
jgi:3-dehydroquinate dehydratase type I